MYPNIFLVGPKEYPKFVLLHASRNEQNFLRCLHPEHFRSDQMFWACCGQQTWVALWCRRWRSRRCSWSPQWCLSSLSLWWTWPGPPWCFLWWVNGGLLESPRSLHIKTPLSVWLYLSCLSKKTLDITNIILHRYNKRQACVDWKASLFTDTIIYIQTKSCKS